uniref:Leucyl/phenylalanyl-tRNA--protein transferase n=1 Tax=Ditylum brightwellii TaxID=49249 RepID=A0A7S4UT52_9STRA|mmetsp:Transcript_36690/g.56179  ORF Transcript_36690/g.56179 Transcript_36690/m.56179 type:complete len:535 (+) Transcript_36690:122-1726(+)
MHDRKYVRITRDAGGMIQKSSSPWPNPYRSSVQRCAQSIFQSLSCVGRKTSTLPLQDDTLYFRADYFQEQVISILSHNEIIKPSITKDTNSEGGRNDKTTMAKNNQLSVTGENAREEDAIRRCASISSKPKQQKSHSPPPSSSDPPASKTARVSAPQSNGGDSSGGHAAAQKDATKADASPSKGQTSPKQALRKTAPPKPEPILYYLPPYLSNMVFPYHDEFYQSLCYDPRLMVQLMSEGFLPIATSRALLPKLHYQRSAIRPPLRQNIHISRSTRKKSGKFELTIDKDFDAVVKGCHAQHGVSWLYPRIVAGFLAIHRQPDHKLDAMIFDSRGRQPTGELTPVRIHSVEVWSVQTGKIVAGELGYTVGNVYTSLTGFSSEDSAGTVQLAALGVLLEACGFQMWDLGMGLDYKTKLGAVDVPRDEFVRFVRGSRTGYSDVVLQMKEQEWKEGNGEEKNKDLDKKEPQLSSKGRVNTRDIINRWRQDPNSESKKEPKKSKKTKQKTASNVKVKDNNVDDGKHTSTQKEEKSQQKE